MYIHSIRCALPPHYYNQQQLVSTLTDYWSRKHHNPARVERFHEAVQVTGRYLALPIDQYESLSGFGATNSAFIEVGLQLGERAIREALHQANLSPRDVDAIYTTSVTGIATPSIDARLVNRLDLRTDVKRMPIFGLGCVAGAAGVARLSDYLRAWPNEVAVLLSVELCSLTLQPQDLSIPNLIATGLFGDGAAALIGVGEERASTMGALETEHRAPRVRHTRSRFYPNSERVMGWDVGDRGFKIVLSAEVPQVVERYLGDDVRQFLTEHNLKPDDIQHWVCHPGGPRILNAVQTALGLDDEALSLTWESLRDIGNLSSASVLFVLEATMSQRKPQRGELGLMIAMGPGFCAELVLLEW